MRICSIGNSPPGLGKVECAHDPNCRISKHQSLERFDLRHSLARHHEDPGGYSSGRRATPMPLGRALATYIRPGAPHVSPTEPREVVSGTGVAASLARRAPISSSRNSSKPLASAVAAKVGQGNSDFLGTQANPRVCLFSKTACIGQPAMLASVWRTDSDLNSRARRLPRYQSLGHSW